MSFGLKNVGATYQRLVDKAFQKQIGQNLEVYVDVLVIKIRMEQEIIRDMEETFKTLREINMKLNPKKCAFGMREGTFLGYKVNADGLRECLDEVEVVLNLTSPKYLKDVHKLNGKLARLNRFLSKSAEKSLPFFKTLNNHALQGPKINYTLMEKLILALVSASKRLKRYFQAYTIIVIKDQPIKRILSNPEVIERLLKWSFELEEHDIHYRPRTSIKGQILADFIMESSEDDPPDTPMEDKEEPPDPWILFTDGSSCIDGSGADLIITNPKGIEFTYALRFRFDATNNKEDMKL
ncbi:reverse transcriptase domain-containing protein [Tanacetum coccineum]